MTASSPASPRPVAPFPSGAVRRIEGLAVPLVGNDIDTDRIIPARFLKCVSFEGLAAGTFADDRQEQAGAHPFDRPDYQGATILVVNGNFGCGSSREHAPQALMRWGIRALVGESFAEIFFGNCLALGIPCLSAPAAAVGQLQAAITAAPASRLRLDLEELSAQLEDPRGGAPLHLPLQLAEGARSRLMSGQWDGTSLLVAHGQALAATAARLPYLTSFSG
jgi:3-isopropylmalate/(R)-2-methylmalate dehydratase small subunit